MRARSAAGALVADGVERGDDLGGRRKPLGRRLAQAARDHLGQAARARRDSARRAGGASLSSTRATVASGVAAAKRVHAAGVLVEQHAEREDVGAGVDRSPLICSGAMYAGVPISTPGWVTNAAGRRAIGAVDARQAEVENLQPPVARSA